jgi:thioredoxin-dependent peroxiredoxin
MQTYKCHYSFVISVFKLERFLPCPSSVQSRSWLSVKKGIEMALGEGELAPDFSLPNDAGNVRALSELRGKEVVLFFYPKDDTTACTTEAQDFSRLKGAFEAAGAVLIGMSPDSAKKHAKFRDKQRLSVELLADETTETLQAYGVWAEKSMYGRKYMGVIRTTLLINRNGRIARIWDKVSVTGHAEEVLEAVRSLI